MLRSFRGVALLGILVIATRISAEEFPTFDQLPVQPELPDPLQMLDGRKITTADEWYNLRQPELKRLFQHYMYGYLPPKPQRWIVEEVLFTDPEYMNGAATISESRLAFFGPDLKHRLHVMLVTPNRRPGKVPVFIAMNFCGNYALTDHPQVHIPQSWVYKSCRGTVNDRATEEGRGGQIGDWNLDLIIERGYGLASFCSGDIDPDTADFSDGIEPAYYEAGQTGPKPADAGTIAAWAWGYHRVVDFLLQQHAGKIDPQRIAAVGHSRNGKTTLLAAAMDERIGLAIPHQAGCGGTAPDRVDINRKDVETIRRINTVFPHWFCDNFTLFNEHPDKLPFDQHCLLALCAPRPVLCSNAVQDQWANPDGQFEMLKGADPVYRLLNVEGLAATEKPELGKLVDSKLGYYIRSGSHSMNREDWKIFLQFADRHFGNAGK